MNEINNDIKWSDNVIIADADFVDKVAFDLIVNFERMIGRRIPKADMARWLVCVALDGGIRNENNDVQVLLIHDASKGMLENFNPGNMAEELDGMAFKDRLGEFSILTPSTAEMVTKQELICDVLTIACSHNEVKRIMVIPDDKEGYAQVRQTLAKIDDDNKRITLFAMQPMPGGNFRQEILGYSLMSAIGIKADEIKE